MNDETIFAEALEKPTPAERVAYLDSVCGADLDRRKKIEALLAAHDKASGFLEKPPMTPPEPEHAATRTHDVSDTPPSDGVTRTHAGGAEHEADDSLAFLAPPGRPDSLGRIGHYEVLEVLGKGGFGIVFRAFDEMLQRVVAVKVLAPSMAVTSPARKRFLREARASASVRHENVVQVHAVEEQPLPYIVMEYVPGETLQDRLDRTGPLDVGEVLRIGRQIAEGLAAAHEQGLIHRDIKPSNILIDGGPHEHVKITDFGLARAADDASLTRSGVIAGTPMYMAPEQARGESLDHRADLFSLGSVLYAILTGRPPFRATGTMAVLKRVCDDDPRPIREVIPEVPEWLCRIVEKLHAKNPDERFQTAREVADTLADCEQQFKTHSTLTDYSRIPGGKPRPRGGWKRVAAALVLLPLVAYGAVLSIDTFWPATQEQSENRGELILENVDPDWDVTIVQRGEVIYDRSSLRSFKLDADIDTELQFVSSSTGRQIFRMGIGVRRGEQLRINAGEELTALEQRTRDGVSNNLRDIGKAVNEFGDSGNWVQLFNGKDLTGWKYHPDQEGGWKIEGGVLIGRSDTDNHLFTERDDYSDFHFRAEVKASQHGNGGVYLRAPFALRTQNGHVFPPGYEAQILPSYPQPNAPYTGSLYGLVKLQKPLVGPDEWFTLEVIAQGDRIVVKVNDQVTADVRDTEYRRGHIALQAMSDAVVQKPTVIEFRKIEIKELSSTVMLSNPSRIVSKGRLLPMEVTGVYPSSGGIVREVRVKPSDQLKPGEEIAILFSRELELAHTWATNELNAAKAKAKAAEAELEKPELKDDDKLRLTTEIKIAQAQADAARKDLSILDQRHNTPAPIRPGYFRVLAPEFSPDPTRRPDTRRWTVLSDLASETPVGQPVPPSQEIARLADLAGPWQVELMIPQSVHSAILVAFANPDQHKVESDPDLGNRKYLDVEVALAGQPGTVSLGRLYRDEIAHEIVPIKDAGTEPTTRVRVKLDVPEIPEARRVPYAHRVAGREVHAAVVIPRSDGFVPLFNGKDLTGWTTYAQLPRAEEVWKITDGVLRGQSKDQSILFTKREDFRDFHLRAEARIEAGADSGVLFRHWPGGKGYSVEIHPMAESIPTGSLWRHPDLSVVGMAPRDTAPRPGEWFRLEVIARGPHIQVIINGRTTVDIRDSTSLEGRIELVCQGDGGGVEFRKIEIKELLTIEDQLCGKWNLTGAKFRGKPVPLTDVKNGLWLKFSGSAKRMEFEGKEYSGTITAQNQTSPYEIDFHSEKRGLILAIAKVEGDTLTIAMGEPGDLRPTSFTTTPKTNYGTFEYSRDRKRDVPKAPGRDSVPPAPGKG